MLLKQQCDEPAISTLSQLELQPHIVREVQEEAEVRKNKIHCDRWLKTHSFENLCLTAWPFNPEAWWKSRINVQMSSKEQAEVDSSHSVSRTVLGSDTADAFNCGHRQRPLSVMSWNQAKVTPSVNSSHNNILKVTHMLLIPRGSFVCLFNHACATGHFIELFAATVYTIQTDLVTCAKLTSNSRVMGLIPEKCMNW